MWYIKINLALLAFVSCDFRQPLDPSYYCLNSSGQTVTLVYLREISPTYELTVVDSVVMPNNDKGKLSEVGFKNNPFGADEARVYFNDELAFTYRNDLPKDLRDIRDLNAYDMQEVNNRRRGEYYIYTYVFTPNDYQRFLDSKTND